MAQPLEYRADLLAKTLMSAFWLVWAAVGVSVYFRYTGDIAGWSHGGVLVVVGLFFAVNGIRQAFLEPNLALMREYVRRGTLDHVLTQPVDSQVLVSLRHVDMHILVGADELGTVSFSVVELSRFPVQADRQPLQTILVVVPVAFLTTLPASALLGRLDPVWLVVSPVVAVAAVAAASFGWRRVLRRYTGASA